jgi:hypothetical protein
MEILSALISGTLAIAGVLLGFVLGLLSGIIVWLWKARGIRHMLADEVEINWNAFDKWETGDPWPVRSIYIWQSLQPVVPGILSRNRVKALARFYYRQAEIYKERDKGHELTVAAVERLDEVARETLQVLGRTPPASQALQQSPGRDGT